MVIELIVIAICFIVFLFTLYTLSREDFVFLRKNVTIENIFNVAFIAAFFTMLFARLGYVLLHFDMSYLNPLVFFLIPYFPGLSLLGGVIGGVVTILLLTKKKKYPRGRFVDFFAYSFLSILPIGYAGYIATGQTGSIYYSVVPIIYYSILFFFFMRMLLPRFLQGQMRDGMLGLLILMNYSLFTSVLSVIKAYNEKTPLLTPQIVILLILFVLCLLLYIKQGTQLNLKRK